MASCKTDDEKKRTAEIIRPILRGRDIKRYGYEWAGLYLIYIPWHFPYQFDPTIQGASIEAEEAFREQYPSVYSHMLQYKIPLAKRNKAETGIRYEWYAMQRWGAKYWDDFFKPKIVYGQFQDGAEYSFAEEGIFLSSNEYMLISNNYSSKCLLAFLNCKVSEWLLGNITGNLGGNAKIGQKSNFMKLSVAQLSPTEQKTFDKLVDEIISMKKRNLDSSSIESVIDHKIYKIYGLNDTEINEIESF